jgi:hypothetical protein
MKKTSKYLILVFIVLIILIAPAAVYFDSYNKQTSKIKEINKSQYSFLKCISNCSIIHSGNKSYFKPECLENCTTQSNITKSQEFKQYQLINDYEYVACTRKINSSDKMTLEKYQTCLIELLPKLQARYSYLK